MTREQFSNLRPGEIVYLQRQPPHPRWILAVFVGRARINPGIAFISFDGKCILCGLAFIEAFIIDHAGTQSPPGVGF